MPLYISLTPIKDTLKINVIKILPVGSIWVWISPLKFISNRIQRNLTESSAKFVFSGRSENPDDCPGIWETETFTTPPLKPLNGFHRNLIGSKIPTSATKFVFSDRSENQDGIPASDWQMHVRLLLWIKPLNGIQRNMTGSKIPTSPTKTKMAAMASDWLRYYRLLHRNRLTEFNELYSQEARSQRPLPKLCFFFSDRLKYQDGCSDLW